MRQRRALVIIDFLDAHQTLRNVFSEQIRANDWRRYPGMSNAYCTTFLGESPDEDLVTQTEADLWQAAELAGIGAWEAVCLLEDAIHLLADSGRSQVG